VSYIRPRPSPVALLTLREVRHYVRRSHAVGLAALIGIAYALGSMVLGGMLVLARLSGGYTVTVIPGNALGIQPWNYPGLLIAAPWGFVILPFFATIAMVIVSAGVGLGMATAIVLGVQLVRERKRSVGRPAATGTIAGLTPAMIALVTLGACCSVTAGATAGVGLVAQASGSTTSNLLYNNWYLGVFQICVVYVALIAQELLLRVYGRLLARGDPAYSEGPAALAPFDRRSLAVGALRAGLLGAGVTWSLAVVASWTTTDPSTASAALWFSWLIQHWLVGGLAIVVGLSPQTFRRSARWIAGSAGGLVVRAFLLIGAWTLAGWVPPPLAGLGIEGFGNEVLGSLGASPATGAISPAFSLGVALVLRWGFQYLLLGAFAYVVARRPVLAADWIADVRTRSPTSPSAVRTTPAAPAEL